jgi:hypothetical protein
MNISMWEDLKEKVSPDVHRIMERIEKENNVSYPPKEMEIILKMFDVDGVMEIEVIFPEDGCTVCNVFYDPDSDEMRDAHWRKLLIDKSGDILYDMQDYVEFFYRRKKKKPFGRRFPNAR